MQSAQRTFMFQPLNSPSIFSSDSETETEPQQDIDPQHRQTHLSQHSDSSSDTEPEQDIEPGLTPHARPIPQQDQISASHSAPHPDSISDTELQQGIETVPQQNSETGSGLESETESEYEAGQDPYNFSDTDITPVPTPKSRKRRYSQTDNHAPTFTDLQWQVTDSQELGERAASWIRKLFNDNILQIK